MSIQIFQNQTQYNQAITKNFTVGEFACQDGTDKVVVDVAGVTALQQVRDLFGRPLVITSAYRTQSHNRKVGGATNSYHLKGQAFDGYCRDISVSLLAKAYQVAGFGGIITYRANRFVHADTRSNHYYGDSVTGRVDSFLSTLRLGSHGQEVCDLQWMLNFVMDSHLTVDGVFGDCTQAVVRAYQQGQALTVDGICGKQTWTSLLTKK